MVCESVLLCVSMVLTRINPAMVREDKVVLYALHPYGRTTHALPAGDMHQHKGVSGNGTHPRLGMGKAQISFWMDHEGAFFGVTDGHILGWL